MSAHTYAQLIQLKRWADQGLYDVVLKHHQQLSAEDAFLALRVLDHIHVVDRIFQHHLQGTPHAFAAPRSDEMPELGALADNAREVDDWYVAYANGVTTGELDQPVDFVFTSGKPARLRRSEILLHVCLHGTYHRGNIGALLQLRGLSPSPDSVTDFLDAAA